MMLTGLLLFTVFAVLATAVYDGATCGPDDGDYNNRWAGCSAYGHLPGIDGTCMECGAVTINPQPKEPT